MAKQDDEEFLRAVTRYLVQGLHTRRGLSKDEYVTLCRIAWDSCQGTVEFPFKVLIDPLQPAENLFLGTEREYVHWRAADSIDSWRNGDTAIRCATVGPVGPDLNTAPAGGERLLAEDSDVPEARRYILGLFDVLGFAALLQAQGLERTTALYAQLVEQVLSREPMRTHSIIRFSKSDMGSIFGTLPIRHAHFSDTIMLWVPLAQHFIAPFLARCADMAADALRMGLPLRGAVAAGKAILHPPSGTFLGQPIIEAARLEQAQDWLGVSLGLSMLSHDVAEEFDPNLVVAYRVPMKRRSSIVSSGYALDWPRRFRERYGTSPATDLRRMNTSASHRRYYDNAENFATFCQRSEVHAESSHTPNVRRLARAALSARETGKPLAVHETLALRDLAKGGEEEAAVATFIRQLAGGGDLPAIPRGLLAPTARLLRELRAVAGGDMALFPLPDAVLEALRTRLCHLPVSDSLSRSLTTLERHAQPGRDVAALLRGIAAGKEPKIPRGLPADMRSLLREALSWATQGRVPRGILNRAFDDCLSARVKKTELDAAALRNLDLIGATGGEWPAVALFLRAIASGEEPSIPAGLRKEIRASLTRLQYASVPARVQAPRTLDMIAVGFGDPPTGVDLFALATGIRDLQRPVATLPSDMEEALREFEMAAPERRSVGRLLRAFATSAEPPSFADRHPMAVAMVLAQLQAIIDGTPIPLDPDIVTLSAARARHGRDDIGDCALVSLRAMTAAGGEWASFARYSWQVAKGGSAIPIPQLEAVPLKEAAEELRSLAEPAIGGIRLMMSPADNSNSPSGKQ